MLPYLGLSFGVAVCAIYLAGGPALGVLSLLLAVGTLKWLSPSMKPVAKGKSSMTQATDKMAEAATAQAKPVLADTLQGVNTPAGDNGLIDLGQGEPCIVENDYCTTKTMYAFKTPEKSGLFNEHFAGKKRLWEIRWQIRVKQTPKNPLLFGIELAEYVPVSGWSRRVQQMTVAMLRKVAGKDLYHSAGDDPRKTSGETERPGFAMPLWAFDQLVISEEGEEPNIRDLEGRGVLRTEGRADFVRTMNSLELQPGKVYTFSFWSISRFVDVLNWKMLGVVPGGMDFSVFCGRPPVHVVIYELEDSEDPRETRHLQSRKRYWFNLALWSTKVPPSQPQIRAMLWEGSAAEAAEEDTDAQEAQSSWCCWR
mmetsp:Transcript_30168/g.89595  ORF Transcript_30168/g.89595 Transcript_30168/m.89595 type:complete len:367 (+) Transcript_30168:78-1178(+)